MGGSARWSGKQGLGVDRVALVKIAELGHQFLCVFGVLIGSENGTGETGALHLHDLVDQDLTRGADVAHKSTPAAKHDGLAESAPIGEFGEMQVDAPNVLELALETAREFVFELAWVDGVVQNQHELSLGALVARSLAHAWPLRGNGCEGVGVLQ